MSVQQLPNDVLTHYIFVRLAPFMLVPTIMVCRSFRKVASRFLPPQKNHRQVMASLFKDGAPLKLVLWFERDRSYPVWGTDNRLYKEIFLQNILAAAEGKTTSHPLMADCRNTYPSYFV
jgi:hypothetical protein